MSRIKLSLIVVFVWVCFAASSLTAQTFNLDTNSLSFNVNAGSKTLSSQNVTLTNLTNANLSVSVGVTQGGNFLSASLSRNPVPGNQTATIKVSVDSSRLNPGNYTGNVQVSAGGTTRNIQVGVSVNGVSISVSPNSLNATLQAGQGRGDKVTITGGPSNLSVSVSGGNWLDVAGTPKAPGSLTVQTDATGLQSGTYQGAVSLDCVGGSPCVTATIAVTLTVTNSMLSPSPSSFSFTTATGKVTPAQSMTVRSSDGTTLQYSAGATVPWIRLSTGGGAANSTGSSIAVSVDATALQVGSQTGAVVLSCIGVVPCATVNVPVTATITASATTLTADKSTLAFQAATGGAIPSNQTVNITSSDQSAVNFGISASSPGNWLRATANQATTPAVVTASITSLPAASSNGTITITPGNGAPNVVINVSLTIGAAVPIISQSGVITAGAFGGSSTLGAGTYIEVYGSNLAQNSVEWGGADFVAGTAPTTIGNVRMTVNGQPAFIRFVSAGQVNALVPGNAGTGPAQIVLTNSNGSSAPYTVTLSALTPGVLAPPALQFNGRQYVAGFQQDGAFAMPNGSVPGVNTHPVAPGDTVVFYGIGFGAVDPDVAVGRIAPNQLTNLRTPVQILFGQTQAVIGYQGLAPNFVGLYQFNVTVPSVADNDAVQLTFTQGGTQLPQKPFIAVAHR